MVDFFLLQKINLILKRKDGVKMNIIKEELQFEESIFRVFEKIMNEKDDNYIYQNIVKYSLKD